MFTTHWRIIVLTGVLYTGCTLVSTFGSEPERAIAYHTRVPMLQQAIVTATVEFKSANRINHQTGPHTRLATTTAGSSCELGSFAILFVPQPIMMAQVTKTKKQPSKMIEPITARETFLVRFLLSPARGAAPSQPVKPCNENTMATANEP